ncbi:SpoIID/LytB domain-containing protein [Metabacillus sp. HB246100]
MKKKLVTILFPILLVIALLPSFPQQTSAATGEITVRLVNSKFLGKQSKFNIEIVGSYINLADNTKFSGTYTLEKTSDSQLLLYKSGQLVKSYNGSFSISPAKYGEENYIKLNDLSYLGDMVFKVEGNYITPSNTLALDDYLKGVVPSEMLASWPLEALKSQAVAARTYASSYIGKTTIDDTQSYQVYGGYIWNKSAYDNSNKSVEATTGEIITFNGKSLGGNALYYSSNGGLSLSNTNTWGNGLFPYFRTGIDSYDLASTSPHKDWSFSLLKDQINIGLLDLNNPAKWWSSTSESQSSTMENFKKWMYSKKVDGKNIMNSDYEMKITGISAVEFTNPSNLTSTSVLNGKITINYMLKNKKTGLYRLDSKNNIEVYNYEILDESYNIRSLIGSTQMKSPYIKSVTNNGDRFTVNGGGFGHGIGMSQYGASEMAKTKTYNDILAFYYPGTKLITDNNLLYTYPIEFDSLSASLPSPQKAGTAISINALTTGGKDPLYAFHLYDGTEWKEVQPYSSNKSYLWKPVIPGTYTFSVHAKETVSTNRYDDYETFTYTITAEDVNLTSIDIDKQSPQKLGETIRVNANANGGYNLIFAYHLYDGKEWKEIQPYSNNQSLIWTPIKPGNYRFSVHVKDVSSNQLYDDYGVLDYTVSTDSIIFPQIQVDKLSPQNTGQTINLTSVATGGYDLQYAYHLYDGKEWKTLRPYSSDKSFTWTPEKAGKYKFSVHVKSSTSGKVYETYKTLDYEIKQIEPVKTQSLTVDKPSPQVVGSSINLSASATGGSKRLYKFHVYDGREWTVLRDYQVSNSIQWQPTRAGEYKLVVHVKDQSSSKEYDSYKAMTYTMKEIPVDIQSVEVNYTSPQAADTTINLTAKATGGVTKEYKYNVFDGKQWKVLRDYSTDPTVQWTPKTSGKYKFSVHVKDSNSSYAYDDYYVFYYDVVNKVSISKLSYPSGTQAVNKPIEISAATTGGTKSLYRFWVEENGEWKIIQDYSPTSKVTWTPKEAKTYKFSVHVKDHYSTKEYDTYRGFTISVR